jgi:hypothetical protein
VRAASIVSEVCERNYVFDLAKSSAAKTELVRKGFNCLIPDDIPLMHSPHLTQYQWGKIVVEMPAVKNSIAAAANILAKPKMLEWKWYIDRLEDYFLPFANAIKYATRDLLLKGIPQDKKSTWPPELGEMVKVFFKSISNDVEFSGLQARDVVITPGVSEVQPSCFENKDPVAIDQPGETEPALLVSCREMVSAEVIYNDSPSWQAYQFMINQIRRGEADDVRMFLYDTAVLQPDLHRAVWTHLFKDRVGGNVVGIPIDSPFLACQKSEADSIFESLKAQV